jgi:hypothetical protein
MTYYLNTVDVRLSSSTHSNLHCDKKTDNCRSTTSFPFGAVQHTAREWANLTTMPTIPRAHATVGLSHASDIAAADRLNTVCVVLYISPFRGDVNLAAIYTMIIITCCACNENDQLQRPSSTAEGFWCAHLDTRSWTLGRVMKLFSTAALHNFWNITMGIYMYACFAALTSRSHVHQSALPVGSMLQILILSWISYGGVVLTGGRYGFVPIGAFSLVVISLVGSIDLLACACSPSYRHNS